MARQQKYKDAKLVEHVREKRIAGGEKPEGGVVDYEDTYKRRENNPRPNRGLGHPDVMAWMKSNPEKVIKQEGKKSVSELAAPSTKIKNWNPDRANDPARRPNLGNN